MKKKSRIATRKIRFLESELRMLQCYNTEALLLYEEYKLEYVRDIGLILSAAQKAHQVNVSKDLAENCEEPLSGETLNIDPDLKSQTWRKTSDGWEKEDEENFEDKFSEDDIAKTSHKAPPWAKKLYKRIAMASHPDLTSKDSQSKKLKNIFVNSAEAMNSGDFNKLLGLALELDIKLPTNDIDTAPLFRDQIKSLKQQKADIEKNIEWLWGEGLGIPQMRLPIAKIAITRAGYDLKNEELLDIIAKIEEE